MRVLTLTCPAGRLIDAWTGTPTKWYPLPLAVGALLLVALQYRKKIARAEKEVLVDADGHEIIKLKGPWQVRPSILQYTPRQRRPMLAPSMHWAEDGGSSAIVVLLSLCCTIYSERYYNLSI